MQNYTLEVTTLKTDKDGFNSMPSRKEIEKAMADHDLNKWWICDVKDKANWQNADDTIVLAIEMDEGVRQGLKLGKFAIETGADEFDCLTVHDSADRSFVVVRLWWD